MKPLNALLSWICAGSLSLAAQTSPAPATLTGIVNLPGYKCVLLSVAGPRPGWPPTELILREGERVNRVELLHILPERGAVELRLGGSNLVAFLSSDATHAPAIAFNGVGVKSALEIYAELSGRTLLRDPTVPNRALTLRAFAGDKAEAAKILSDAFATNGIAVIPDGDKFALVVPKAYVAFVHPRSAEIKPADQSADADKPFIAGGVIFNGVDFAQAAKTYAELNGREINQADWPPATPNPQFWFKNQTPLTKAEMIYAFDTLFEWVGLKMVPDGDKFLKPELIRWK